jgi:hypothetical protein
MVCLETEKRQGLQERTVAVKVWMYEESGLRRAPERLGGPVGAIEQRGRVIGKSILEETR